MFDSPAQTLDALAQVGYLTDPITATTVYLAEKLHKPLLLEGPAGSGKTELSYAVIDLHNHLFETLEALKDPESPMDVERAKAVCHVADTLIESAKVELKFMELLNKDEPSPFFRGKQLPPPAEGPRK